MSSTEAPFSGSLPQTASPNDESGSFPTSPECEDGQRQLRTFDSIETLNSIGSNSTEQFPKDDDILTLFYATSARLYKYPVARPPKDYDSCPNITEYGLKQSALFIVSSGHFQLYKILGKTISYIKCGTMVHPLLPKMRIWKILKNQYLLPQPSPGKYWRLEIQNVSEEQSIDDLDRILTTTCYFQNLYVPDSTEENSHSHSLYKRPETTVNNSPSTVYNKQHKFTSSVKFNDILKQMESLQVDKPLNKSVFRKRSKQLLEDPLNKELISEPFTQQDEPTCLKIPKTVPVNETIFTESTPFNGQVDTNKYEQHMEESSANIEIGPISYDHEVTTIGLNPIDTTINYVDSDNFSPVSEDDNYNRSNIIKFHNSSPSRLNNSDYSKDLGSNLPGSHSSNEKLNQLSVEPSIPPSEALTGVEEIQSYNVEFPTSDMGEEGDNHRINTDNDSDSINTQNNNGNMLDPYGFPLSNSPKQLFDRDAMANANLLQDPISTPTSSMSSCSSISGNNPLYSYPSPTLSEIQQCMGISSPEYSSSSSTLDNILDSFDPNYSQEELRNGFSPLQNIASSSLSSTPSFIASTGSTFRKSKLSSNIASNTTASLSSTNRGNKVFSNGIFNPASPISATSSSSSLPSTISDGSLQSTASSSSTLSVIDHYDIATRKRASFSSSDRSVSSTLHTRRNRHSQNSYRQLSLTYNGLSFNNMSLDVASKSLKSLPEPKILRSPRSSSTLRLSNDGDSVYNYDSDTSSTYRSHRVSRKFDIKPGRFSRNSLPPSFNLNEDSSSNESKSKVSNENNSSMNRKALSAAQRHAQLFFNSDVQENLKKYGINSHTLALNYDDQPDASNPQRRRRYSSGELKPENIFGQDFRGSNAEANTTKTEFFFQFPFTSTNGSGTKQTPSSSSFGNIPFLNRFVS